MADKITSVWMFDQNRRKYEYDETGRSIGPIYLHHWYEVDIISETSRSWVTRWGDKISKKNQPSYVCNTYAEVLDKAFINDNRYKVSEEVNRIKDADLLRKIIELLDVTP